MTQILGKVTVVNMHHLPGKQLPDASYVYIGRPRRGGALDLGNPIALADHGNDRDAVIEAYRAYAKEAWSDPKNPLKSRIVGLAERVWAGEELKLVCWCAPKTCHGDVIKAVVDNLVERRLKTLPPTARPVRP